MNTPGQTNQKGLIAWFASNHVAANLLMLLILAFGIVSSITIRKQTTPDFELQTIQVSVPYLGAAPQEVEEGVVIKIEEAIQDIDGIVEINSTAREGRGTVVAEVATGEDINEVLNEIKTRVDAISTFPALTEKPVIEKQEVPIHVVFVALHGNMDEYARKAMAQQIRDAGCDLGIYQDLALGSSVNSADTWMEQGLYAAGAQVGPALAHDELRDRPPTAPAGLPVPAVDWRGCRPLHRAPAPGPDARAGRSRSRPDSWRVVRAKSPCRPTTWKASFDCATMLRYRLQVARY